jgi:hypothetical protein
MKGAFPSRAGLVAGLLRRAVRDREGAMLVVPVLLVGVVEGFEERLLLVLVVLVGLLLRQIGDLAVRHGRTSAFSLR